MRRVWQRALSDPGDGRIEVPLRFRVVPGVWPEIAFAPADGTRDEISAASYELRLRFRGPLTIDVAGYRADLPAADEDQELIVAIDGGQAGTDELVASAVTENVTGFRLTTPPPAVGRIQVGDGGILLEGMVFGLEPERSELYDRAAGEVELGEVFYASEHFIVHDGGVMDDDLPALVPDGRTIVSPIRVVEEFGWRDNDLGDMIRVVDRGELWRSAVEPGRYPRLCTRFRSVDAAFELALETFQRNASAEFALPGETGMWSAGYFQGPGLGFGVWRRDTAHIALRGGNLLDPEVARASLLHTVQAGFDNGSDGDALPAVAIWDHVLATGDESLARECFPRLLEVVAALDARFDEARGLVTAPQSTSNDLFAEPENGGFALSTEIYAMQSYEAIGRVAALVGDARGAAWSARADLLRRAILDEYWDEARCYWTSGPRGTAASVEGIWETSGTEAALWGYLGPEGDERATSVLRAMDEVAMSEYGVVLFPHRAPENHFTGTVWYCWQAGIARGAARTGDAELIHRLVGQQVRSVVRNKTFYEVTEAATGESWRWPGQLWHAAGFVSLVLYGVLGLRYDLDGLTFQPAVAPVFDGLRLTGFRYRAARLDIEVHGHGTHGILTIDGAPAERVAPDLTGRHRVVLTMR